MGNLTSTCTLPLNIKPQHLVLPVVLAIEDLLPRLSHEPELLPTKLQKLLHQQYQAQLLNSLILNRLQLLLHQMGNVLLYLWVGVRGFRPSASWTGRTASSCLSSLMGLLLRLRWRKIFQTQSGDQAAGW